MKKLVVILLIGIYATAVFAAGASSFDCCEKAAAFFSTASIGDSVAAQHIDNDYCNNLHESFASSNVHIVSTSHHINTRLFYGTPHTGLINFTAAVPAQPSVSILKYKNHQVISTDRACVHPSLRVSHLIPSQHLSISIFQKKEIVANTVCTKAV